MHVSFDPHDELGVPGHASQREIRDAYRRLAAQWHPDRNTSPSAAERMARINRAYRHLCDTGHAPRDVAEPEAEPAPGPQPQAAPEVPRANRSWWNRDWSKARWEADGSISPKTLKHEAVIRLEDAAFGCRHRVKGVIADLCTTCHGVGRLVSRRSDCRMCRGEGRLKMTGPAGGWQPCAGCHGDGSERKPCDDCDGGGHVRTPRGYYFDVHVPAGVRDGQTVVLRGQGQRGPDEAGNIDLAIRVKPHPLFSFDAQRRLCCEVPVDIFSMLGGGSVEIPNLDGSMTSIDLSRGATQVIEGQGYPKRDGRRGPLVVTTRGVTPEGFSSAQTKLLRQLADDLRRSGHAHSPELAAWQRQVEACRRHTDPPAA